MSGIDTGNVHLLEAVVTHPGAIYFTDDSYCEHITLQQIYLFLPRIEFRPCLESRVISFRILADFWNLTLKLGGAVSSRFNNAYPDIYLDQDASLAWEPFDHIPETYQIILWDYHEFSFLYCVSANQFKVESLFIILFSPFDFGTWVCVCISTQLIFGWFRSLHYAMRDSTLSTTVLEVVAVFLQRTVKTRSNSARSKIVSK